MKLSDILGSISPAYGLVSGDGLGGMLRYGNLPFLLGRLFQHHNGGHPGQDGQPQHQMGQQMGRQQMPLSSMLMMQGDIQPPPPPFG